jgi:hypothetical protein
MRPRCTAGADLHPDQPIITERLKVLSVVFVCTNT